MTAIPAQLSTETAAPAAPQGQPKGLYVLFFTEMWERFSYYGMRALLVYYMLKYLFLPENAQHVIGFVAVKSGLEAVFGPMSDQALSSQIYGLYTGFVYFTPFFGGMLADRYLGQRKTVIIGGVLMAIGHFLMAFDSLFYIALLFLIAGNGAFKPNISTQVGLLYAPGDPRRDRAFNTFYMGINLGAFFSPLICGTLGETLGWHWGFGAAGVGMCLGLGVYLWGQKYLATDNLTRTRTEKVETQPLLREDWTRIWALVVLCALNIVFWGVYEQQGNTLALWADANTERHVLPFSDWEMPASWFQSVNPFFIFALTPLINILWARQAKKGKEPSSVIKMAIGCALLGAAFFFLIGGAHAMGADGRSSAWWLILSIFVLTVGEMYLSPVGLSLVTKLAPARLVSMLMGMWFLSSFFGNYMAGYLGTFWETMPKDGFFFMMVVLSIATGAIMFALVKPLRRAMAGADS